MILNSLYKSPTPLVYHNNTRLTSEQQIIIMAITNWIQFGILCALLTGGYGEDCSACKKPQHTLDNVACHPDVAVVIKIKVKSDKLKDKIFGYMYQEMEVLKSYKCDNNSKPDICMNPLPSIARVTNMGVCPGLKLENWELYLMTGWAATFEKSPGEFIPEVFYSGCNFVKKWSDVESDEQKIIDQAAKCPNLQQ